jgi:hypothetical protein
MKQPTQARLAAGSAYVLASTVERLDSGDQLVLQFLVGHLSEYALATRRHARLAVRSQRTTTAANRANCPVNQPLP